MKRNDSTLWGPAQTTKELIPGVWAVSTAGHGGIFLESFRYAMMPDYLKTTPYSRNGFYEEDIDWCLPFVVFAAELRNSTDEHTRKTIETRAHLTAFNEKYHATRRGEWEITARKEAVAQ